jgi:hypothetical protein
MPRTTFYEFVQSIIGFFQLLFLSLAQFLSPVFALSPLPDLIDFILICLLIVGLIYLMVRGNPWSR